MDSDRARPPQVAKVAAVQRFGTKLVDVTYDLCDEVDPMRKKSVAAGPIPAA